MGLEGVELAMEVEERFATSVPDSDLVRMQTVGDLHKFLMTRIRSQGSDVCPSAAMFYPIRRILIDQFGLDRKLVRPATSLASLVSPKNRREFWRTIEFSLATQLPRLRRSKWLQWSGDVFPPECETVSQLVERCVDLSRVTEEFGPDDSDAVFEIVKEMVATVAGVDGTKIFAETNFVTDLGF